MKYILLVIFCMTIFSSPTFAAEPRYVTDSFEVTIRTGKGNTNKILKMLKSGARVELLEEDTEAGYSRVKVDENIEGWVLTRYLLSEPAARTQLEKATAQLASLKAEVDSLQQELKETAKNNNSLSKSSSGLEKENQRLQKELDYIKGISANQLAINDENKELKEKMLALKREIQTIQQENLALKDNSGRYWFLIGAGVCIAGIILGLVLPNLRFRRRQGWNSL